MSDERRINLRVSDDLHARLKMAAARHRTTLLGLVIRWLEERLENDEKAGGQDAEG